MAWPGLEVFWYQKVPRQPDLGAGLLADPKIQESDEPKPPASV
jgi:hypothetical protein